MRPSDAARQLDQIARDLDLAVFSLERPPSADPKTATADRTRLRRDLDALRERVQDLARALETS
jgi:hypothetical protein